MKNPEIIIRIHNKFLYQIKEDLARPHEFAYERVGFVGARHKRLNDGTIIVFITDYYPLSDDHYIDDPKVGARINSTAIRNALQTIIDTGQGLFHTHFHHLSGRVPEFSDVDLIDNPRIVKSFSVANKEQVHGMFLLGENGLNALIKIPGEENLVYVTKLVGVGNSMTISRPTNNLNFKQNDRYDRQSFLGPHAQLDLENVKVGVVGLGGGGSHIVQQLAHLGVKNYALFDFDKVSGTNLNRMVGANLRDVKKKEKKLAIAIRGIKSLQKDAQIDPIEDNWMNEPESLQKCDIVFGCVDSYIARRDLEAECRRYMIPLIDIGMDVHDGYNSEAPSLAGQIILSMPGGPCMHCMGFITERNLAKEAAKYGGAGGRPQVVWANGILASQAIGIFIDLLTGWSGREDVISYYSFDGNSGVLAAHPRLKYINTQCVHYDLRNIGAPVYNLL